MLGQEAPWTLGVGRWRLLAIGVCCLLGVVVVLGAGVGAAEPAAPDCEDVDFEDNGDGYEVENLSQLQCIDEHGLEEDYVLVEDIDASETKDWNDGDGFEPIGDGDSDFRVEGDAFNGTLDGNDRTIANLSIDRSGDDRVGLFEVIGSEGTVSNLTLESATVTGGDRTGGLSGDNFGTVSDVSISTDVDGSGITGGVIGLNRGGTITGATVEGAVFSAQDAGSSRVGGIVGDHEQGASIDSSSFTNGTVDGDNEEIGGIAGRLASLPGYTSSITNSSANGTIGNEDADFVGGLVGEGSGDFFDSYSTATVRGNDTVGGVIGDARNSDIERTYAVGEVDGDGDDVGGLVGVGATGFNTESSYWDIETTGVNESFDSEEDGLTTDEMTGANVTDHMDGFGFPDGDDRWHAVEDDYPALAWEDTDPVYGVEITGTNSAIDDGETLEVDATVTNVGSDGDEQLIELRDFGGDEVDTEEVALTSGESAELTLEWETEEGKAGLDDVTVASENHTDTRTVSVGAGEVIPQCQPIDTAGAYELNDDIEASDDCIEIQADDVSLDGNDHTISGSETGILVDDYSNVTISNVTLSGLDVGIEMTAIDGATVEHNTVEGSGEDGLVFEDVQNSTIVNNTVTSGATRGIHLAEATDTAVENNTLRENDESGMYVVDSEELVISGNEVVDNGEEDEEELGHDVEDAGIYLSGTADSTLEANNLTANAQVAMFLEESSADNRILGNAVNVSVIEGSERWRGIKIEESSGNILSETVITGSEEITLGEHGEDLIYVDSEETVVTDNEIYGHARVGIDILGESNTVDNNSIAGSFHHSDTQNGHAIRVSGTGEDWSVTNNSLTNAEILNPERAGIAIIGDQTVEIQNNTGTKLDSDLSPDPGADLELTNEEQSVDNQQLTTPAGETRMTFTGAGLRLDGVDESPADHDTVESTGYYFEVENTADEFKFENLELDYDETRLTTGDTIDPETLSLWRLDDEWEEIDDSDVDTDEQVVTGNVTEEGRIGVFGEEPVLTDFEVDDVTIEQGEPLEVDLEDAEDSIGDPYDDESELVFEGDVFDEPVTKDVTFEDGNASDVELLDADETAALSAATTTVEVDTEGEDEADSFDLTVEAVLVDFDVADDVTIDQGEPLEVGLEEAEDKVGEPYTGTVDLTGDDIDGQEPSVDNVEFDDAGAVSGVELLDAQTTWGVSAGEYRDVTVEAIDTHATTQFDVTVEEVFAGGDGSEDDPFVVENWDHLDTVRDYPDANVTLATDLDAETDGYGDVAAETANGGDGFEPFGDFEGTFDGDGTTISDLRITRSDESDVGLFGSTSDSATIEDVHLENATVSGESNVGGLVGSLEGAVSSSSTNVTVTGEDGVGGLIGHNDGGDVTTTFAVGDVSGDSEVGGLVGVNSGEVSQSFAIGDVDDSGTIVGGLVGTNEGAVEDSYWNVETTNQSQSDGSDAAYGLTTAEMTGLNATEHMNALAFPVDDDGTWHAVEDDYPALAWEDTGPVYAVTVTDTTSPVTEGDDLEVTATVTNWGSDGERTVDLLSVDGETLATETIDLNSGESDTATLSWATGSGDVGNATVTVDSAVDADTVDVAVEAAPSDPSGESDVSVTGLDLAETRIGAGDELEATVTLTNRGDAIGGHAVDLTIDGEPVATETETVASGETATVTVTETVPEPGTYVVGVDDHEATLEVIDGEYTEVGDTEDADEDQPDDDQDDADPDDDQPADDVPGFGVLVGLLALLAASAAVASARRRVA